jgi:hypothetical protein
MASAPAFPASRSLVSAIGVTGAFAVMLGSALPWLSLYQGLQPITGLEGMAGRGMTVGAAVVVAIALFDLVRGGTAARWLLGLTGFALAAAAVWLIVGLFATAATLAEDPLLVSRIEPGLFVVLAGSLLIVGTLLLPGAGSTSPVMTRVRPALTLRRALVAGSLLITGPIHLLLAPSHLDGSVALGAGFAAVGLGQLALGAAVLLTSVRPAALAIILVNATALVAYFAAVTVGLPIEAHAHDVAGTLTGHGPVGHVEPIDEAGLLVSVAQIVGIVGAWRLFRGRGV